MEVGVRKHIFRAVQVYGGNQGLGKASIKQISKRDSRKIAMRNIFKKTRNIWELVSTQRRLRKRYSNIFIAVQRW